MVKFLKGSGYSLVALVVILAVLALVGGAINWDFEPPYQLVAHWGEKGSGEGQLNDPTGIAVTADEVFVSDAHNNRIQVFDKQGHYKRGFGQARLGRPMNLAIANDKLYVPDYFKDAVFVFSLAGDYQQTITAADHLNSPGGVAVRADGSLLVADTYAKRVVNINRRGKVLKIWGTTNKGGIAAGQFSYPTDVAVAPGGGFYVADGYNDRIQQFGPNGKFVRKWGGPFGLNIYGPFKGWFTTVSSIAVGPDSAIYAADFYNDRLQKFTTDGSFLTAFAPDTIAGPGHSEVAVAVDIDGTVFSVNFKGNRVEKWRPANK